MAHVLTNPELVTQRLPGQWSKTFLAIPEYHVIYSARLNGIPASNDMIAEITMDTESGTLANVLPDMMLLIGSTAGADNLGQCRIRKTPITGTMYISETSSVEWVDNSYLTIIDNYSLWQKSLRVNPTRMDWDIAYSNQHASFDPVPAMGTHRVKKLISASVDVVLGTSPDAPAWVFASTIASQLWTCTGATFDSNTAVNPIATFTVAGTYLVYCAFTAANGKSYTGVRYVIIYDDDNPLVEAFTFSNGRGNFDGGGYSFDATIFSGFDASLIRPRSLVILCTEDYAESAAVIMPSQIEGAENIVCIGWIADIDNTRTSQFGEISFTVESAEYWLRQIRDYPSGLRFKTGTAAAWSDIPLMTVDRACWHFLHWRSTATRVLDFQHTNDGRLATRFQTARANLWERLVTVAQPTIFAAPHVDNFGRLFLSIEPQMIPEADRTQPVVMVILDADIEDSISWVRRDVQAVSMLFLSGISVNTSGGASSFFAMSPGHSYAHFGDEGQEDNYLVESQANAIELCGLHYGWKNNPLDDLEIQFTHSMRVLGIIPNQYFSYTLAAVDDPRGIGYDGHLIPREVNFSQDTETGFIAYSVTFEPESFPGPAIKGDVPTMESVDFSIPSKFTIPALPALPFISLPPTVTNSNHPKQVIIASSNYGIFYTETFDLSGNNVKWLSMNNGLSSSEMIDVWNIHVTPSGAIYIHLLGSEKIFRASGLGGAWVQVASQTEFIYGLHSVGVNPTLNDSVFLVGLGTSFGIPGEARIMTNGVLGATTDPIPLRLNKGVTVFSNGKFLVFGSHMGFFTTPWVARYSPAGAAEYNGSINTAVGQDAATRFGQSLGYADSIFQWDASGTGGFNIITAGGTVATRSTVFTPGIAVQAVAFSPTGTHAMGSDRDVSIIPHKTTDSGATWNTLAGTIPLGSDVFESCKDQNRWVFGGGTVIRLTLDQGATYSEKIGDLLQIAALIDVTSIRMVD